MARFVNSLEARRRTFPKNHPVNLLCKNIGNNAYGKTLQEATQWRYVMAEKCPKGGVHVNEDSETGEPIRGLWIVPESKDTRRCYERPQIGAFITAFIRCVLYDAIMADPDHFVKADTDSVSFTRPQKLPVSSWQYGKWKVESAGAFHIVIAKKVYWTAKHTVCKGLRTKGMGRRLFERWSLGEIPVQTQIQLVSWKKGVAPSWRVQRRRGTHI